MGAYSPPVPDSEKTQHDGVDGGVFDFAGWEAEVEPPLPKGDPTLAEAARELQSTISKHQPIDKSTDWEDFEAYLPERASPLPGANDADARERLRLVLLRAIREGSVPDASIEDLSLGDDGIPNVEACSLLRMVINDVGAETDDRFEYCTPDESFEVVVAPEMTPDEEDTVTEALAFIDNLAERRNDPLRIYQKEFQNATLLTADEEVALGQGMERGVQQALDALAVWPSGIGAVLDAVHMVKSEAKPLRWLSSGPRAELQDIEISSNAEPAADSVLSVEGIGTDDESDSQFGHDAHESTDELSELLSNAELLSGLDFDGALSSDGWNSRRKALASLGLSRGFLLELADFEQLEVQESAIEFSQAMQAYRQARDQMVIANLKLVLFIAKKYLYSGQPLDDLLQEGNIGLIKAVDRYDWRRGFKLSTYATWWIRQQVGRYVADKSKTIRLPVHVYVKTQQIAHAAHAIELATGRMPTIEEIAKKMEMPASKVAPLALAIPEPLPIHDVDVDSLIAIDAQDNYVARDPMDIVSDSQLIGSIDRFLATLKPKDEQVLRLRFGIGAHEAMTLEEIGTRLEVTRERIRQIEAKAICHLKHPARLERLLRDLNGTPPPKREEIETESIESDDATDSKPPSTPVSSSAARLQPVTQSAKAVPRPERIQSTVPTILDKVLAMAAVLGFTVEDERDGKSGRVWVNILETPNIHSRKLVRKMLDLGFEFWPGKGYWR
ncbi:sigma 28 [Rhodoferax ferrireducens T118]|uniref:RNA polymerase sigma factor n=2 Tax=Rhodoferax ferrireducens TaxID=192843 RepID=Q21TX3_ALBFT|nr:sigma 28 [Rhodoferax ferrireducens T118]